MEASFSASVHTGPGDHPASYTMDTGSFPGLKRLGRGINHPPSSSAEVKKNNGAIPLLHPWVVCARVTFTFTFTLTLLMVIRLLAGGAVWV